MGFFFFLVIYLGIGCKWHRNLIFVINTESFTQLIHLLCTSETTHFHDSCNKGFPLVTIGFCFMQFDVIANGILIGMVIHMLSYLEVVMPMNAIIFLLWVMLWSSITMYDFVIECVTLTSNSCHDYYWYYVLHWSSCKIQNNFKSLCCKELYCFLLNYNACSQRQVNKVIVTNSTCGYYHVCN